MYRFSVVQLNEHRVRPTLSISCGLQLCAGTFQAVCFVPQSILRGRCCAHGALWSQLRRLRDWAHISVQWLGRDLIPRLNTLHTVLFSAALWCPSAWAHSCQRTPQLSCRARSHFHFLLGFICMESGIGVLFHQPLIPACLNPVMEGMACETKRGRDRVGACCV